MARTSASFLWTTFTRFDPARDLFLTAWDDDRLAGTITLDVIGGDYAVRNLRATAVRGRIVQVGLMGGGRTPVDLGILLSKRISIIGTVLRARPIEEKIAVTQRFIAEVLPLFESGALRPVIDSRFPLDAIADAHERMAANTNVGKILVDVS